MSTRRLLLVDDDAVFRDRLARALTARGGCRHGGAFCGCGSV